jgi:hypothetical protein
MMMLRHTHKWLGKDTGNKALNGLSVIVSHLQQQLKKVVLRQIVDSQFVSSQFVFLLKVPFLASLDSVEEGRERLFSSPRSTTVP